MNPKILVLGGNGMLGHKLFNVLRDYYDTYATIRESSGNYDEHPLLDSDRLVGNVDVTNFDSIVHAFAIVKPTVVINAVGIVKQIAAAKDSILSLKINSLFPHQLGKLCQASSTRLIQISTDCVFSGQTGNYTESDTPDATDIYGRTKLLGEVVGANCLTIRTSIIGPELERHTSLLDWFLCNPDLQIKGFTQAIFSGFTTLALARILGEIIIPNETLGGLYHISSKPISKYDLLCLIRDKFDKDINIEPYSDFVCDRSLDSHRFQTETNWQPLDWEAMIDDLKLDVIPYYNLE